MSEPITALAVWTVTYDVVSDQGHVISTNESMLIVTDNAGDAIVQTINALADLIRGGHAAITGAAIRPNDSLNSDVSTAMIRESVVGLVDLNY